MTIIRLVFAKDQQITLLDYGATEARRKLKSGEIDGAFIVISTESSIVRDLLETEGVQLINFRRAAACQQKYTILSVTTLPKGPISLHGDIPARDIRLLAPTANLVARNGLHHALIPLILEAVQQVHRSRGLLVESDSFPTTQFTEYPLNQDADRYFRSGPPFLYRYLPFGLAAWLDRVKLILLPMCTLLVPLIKVASPVYRWRIRSKIYRWYRVLHEIDLHLKDADQNLDVSTYFARLRALEQELFEVSVPLSYMEEFYNLRLHVAFVMNRLSQLNRAKGVTRRAA